MKFDGKTAILFLTDLAQTAFAFAFLTAWLICCVIVAFFVHIDAAFDLLSVKFLGGNNARNHESYIRRCCRKQLLKSKTFLIEVPEALGI